ncbi:MAG TPA: amidohydrolase family protein [Acidimicrobiia bacterium]|nr:amidohydrolase family protein [Acidimicrobiia bacterium]
MRASLLRPGASGPVLLGVSTEGRWIEAGSDGGEVIGEGWWALPGLSDAHAHLAADELDLEPGDPDEIRRRAYACLDRGTFLVVDKGWRDNSVLLTLVGAPPLEAPDLEGAGRMIATDGGYYPGFAVETDTEGLAETVRGAVEQSRGWVKLVGDWPRRGRGALPNFDEKSLSTAVTVAHDGGARVAIHTMAPEVASMAVEAGVDSIEHGLFLDPQDLEKLAARGGAWVPTVLRMEAIAAMLGPDSSGGRLIRDGIDNVTALLARVPSGVSVLAGTDLATAPGHVAREVTALVELGLPSERAVDAASVAARRYLGRSEGFVVGEPADAVFFDADPYLYPETLERPAAVIRSGKQLR